MSSRFASFCGSLYHRACAQSAEASPPPESASLSLRRPHVAGFSPISDGANDAIFRD